MKILWHLKFDSDYQLKSRDAGIHNMMDCFKDQIAATFSSHNKIT